MGHLYHGKLLVITRRSRELTDVIDLMATLAFDHDFAVKDWGLSCLQPLAINHGCGKTNMHKTVGDGQCPSISIHDQLRLLEGIAWPLLAKQQNCLQHSHRNQWVRLIQAPDHCQATLCAILLAHEITEGMAESTSLLIIQYYTQSFHT